MPGKVWLFPIADWGSVEYFSKSGSGVELTQEILLWPIRFKNTDPVSAEMDAIEISVFTNILNALTKLEGFVSAIVLKTHPVEKWLEITLQSRINIYFEGNYVLETGMHEGPEIMRSFSGLTGVKINLLEKWSAEKWHDFFMEQIYFVTDRRITFAKEDKIAAENKIKRFESVLRHLGKLPEEKTNKKPFLELILRNLDHSCTVLRESKVTNVFDLLQDGPPCYDAFREILTCLELLRHGSIPEDELKNIKGRLRNIAQGIVANDPFHVCDSILKTIELIQVD